MIRTAAVEAGMVEDTAGDVPGVGWARSAEITATPVAPIPAA